MKMKSILLCALALGGVCAFGGGARSQVRNDGAKNGEGRELVGGYTWTYRTTAHGATVCAVSPKPVGDVVVPSRMGGVNITGIEALAFRGCNEMTSVKIPKSVVNITMDNNGCSSFMGCEGLKSIDVASGNPAYSSLRGVLFNKRKTELVCWPDKKTDAVTIPSGVTSVGPNAFSCCERLRSVTIPPGVTSVGAFAFGTCIRMSSITIPQGVKSIGPYAFHDCIGLTSMTIPSSVISIGKNAFLRCSRLKSVTMCGGRPETPDDVFGSCGELVEIHVPSKCRDWAGMKEWHGIPLFFDADGAASKRGDSTTACVAADKPVSGKVSVAEKLGQCDFLLNKNFKKDAKVYLCLYSASWCGPCRREMPRISKTYTEMLKDDPDIELIHFSRDQDDEKAKAWAKEHDVKFPVVKPKSGNPLDLHCNGIPHLFIVKADGTLLEEGHPMRIFNEEKFREIKAAIAGESK